MNSSRRWTTLTDRFGGTARGGRPSYASRKLAPMVEAVEDRLLLTTGPLSGCSGSGAGFLAGTAFVDSNGDGQLGANDAYLAGATVQLFRVGSCTPLATETTDCHGYYEFDGLQPGDYLLKETPPCGFANSASQAVSQLGAASSVSASTIKVTVLDPTQLVVNYQGVDPSRFAAGNVTVQGETRGNAFGPMQLTLGTAAGRADVNGGYLSFCVNDRQSLSFGGGESYQVVPKPADTLTCSPEVGGRIAYLFNHYGNSSLTNVTGPALQLAVWELLYDGQDQAGPDFNAGNFQVNSPLSPTQQSDLDTILAQAKSYYDESCGKFESAVFLKTATCDLTGQQSMLAKGEFNFGNVTKSDTPPPTCGGGHDHDHDHDHGCGDRDRDRDRDCDHDRDHDRDRDHDHDRDHSGGDDRGGDRCGSCGPKGPSDPGTCGTGVLQEIKSRLKDSSGACDSDSKGDRHG